MDKKNIKHYTQYFISHNYLCHNFAWLCFDPHLSVSRI